MITCYDDIVGLELDHPRRAHFAGQLSGHVERPIIPSGLAPYLHLPAPEPRTLTRARMAAAIAQLVAGSGQVTRDDLVASGFTSAEIADLFSEARRISGVEKMVA